MTRMAQIARACVAACMALLLSACFPGIPMGGGSTTVCILCSTANNSVGTGQVDTLSSLPDAAPATQPEPELAPETAPAPAPGTGTASGATWSFRWSPSITDRRIPTRTSSSSG